MTTITIERSVLEQAFETIVELEYSNCTAVSDKKARDAKIAIRAELAKPVEQQLPDWHDAPTCAGLWTCQHIDDFSATIFNDYEVANFVEPVELENCRWYGPIPQDAAIAKAEGRKE